MCEVRIQFYFSRAQIFYQILIRKLIEMGELTRNMENLSASTDNYHRPLIDMRMLDVIVCPR